MIRALRLKTKAEAGNKRWQNRAGGLMVKSSWVEDALNAGFQTYIANHWGWNRRL